MTKKSKENILDLEILWKSLDDARNNNDTLKYNNLIREIDQLTHNPNIKNIQNVINFRISEILVKLDRQVKILYVNCVQHDTIFNPDIYPKKNIKIINENIIEFANTFEDTISKIKYDIILFQLPLGVKLLTKNIPTVNDLVHKIIGLNLSDFGVALNISSADSFRSQLFKKYPMNLRTRQNILGRIYEKNKYHLKTSVIISIFEIIKISKNILKHPLYNNELIECIDFTEVINGKSKYKDAKLYSAPAINFYDATNTISQNILKEKNKKKKFAQLQDISTSIYRCDLTKSNPNREKVLSNLHEIKNGVFIPTIPSKINKVETNTEDLKPWAYWIILLDPTKVSNSYVMDFLNSEIGKEELLSHSYGSTLKNITSYSVGNIGIVYMDLTAQEKVLKNKKKIQDFIKVFKDYENNLMENIENIEVNPYKLFDKFPDYEINKILNADESAYFERKTTFRYDLKENEPKNYIVDSSLKTLVAFLNTNGGTLIIGQSDDKKVIGIEADKFKNNDAWSKYFKDKVKQNIGLTYLENYITHDFHKYDNKTFVLVKCKKFIGSDPVYMNNQDLYIRAGPTSEKLDVKEALMWMANRNK